MNIEKSVLISIRPKWCKLIALGKKTVEVRKTKPKLETPFKCYIYCTLSGSNEFFKEDCKGDIAEWNRSEIALKKGKVIGEFVCDYMTGFKAMGEVQAIYNETQETCLSNDEIIKYAEGKRLYYWHISDLVIYDKPKELNEFVVERYPCLAKLKRPPQSWCYVEDVEGGVL